MESFMIILKNDKLQSYRRMAVLILLLHLLFFIYYLLKVDTDYVLIGAIALIPVSLTIQIIAIKKNANPVVPAAIVFLLLAAVWFYLQNYWLGAALILLALLDIISVRKLRVSFFADRVELPSFPKRIIQWDELNNAILKDRILTLDFKNDRLLQGEIAPESFGIDENTFTLFCKTQLLNKT